MKPRYLKIEGFLSYQDPVEIDFTEFDLACITGENGAGKSSILDAITWVLFGKARQSNEALINLQSEQAAVSLSFEYSGETYKIKRTNARGKPGRLTLKTPELDLTERTTRGTQEKIESILSINYDTFVSAVFFLQGESDQFVASPPSKRKQVLFDILGLDAWEKYRLAAAAKIKSVENEMAADQGAISMIEDSLQDEDELNNKLAATRILLDGHEEDAKLHRENLAEKEVEYKKHESAIKELEALRARRQNLSEKIKTVEARIRGLEETTREYAAVIDRGDAIRKDYSRHQEILAEIKTVTLAAEGYRKLEFELNALRDKQAAIDAELAKIPDIESEIRSLERAFGDGGAVEGEIATAQDAVAALVAESLGVANRAGELKEQIQSLAGHSTCPLCEQSLTDPAALIAELEGKRDNLLGRREEIEVERKAKLGDIEKMELKLASIRSSQENIAVLKSKISGIRERSRGLDYDRQIPELERKLLEMDYDPGLLPKLKEEAAALEGVAREMGVLETAEGAIGELEGQIAALQQDLLENKDEESRLGVNIAAWGPEYSLADMEALQAEIMREGASLEATEASIRETTKKVGNLEQALDQVRAQKEKLEQLKEQGQEHIETHQVYSTLQEAFSKKGIPALLVEQALPMIEAEANQLLYKLSNGTMAVHFVTQKAYSDASREDMKETLEIEIQDQAGIREYEMYSGGEAFRINFAIRMALSHVLANRAGAKLRTLVIDEGFGSQDAAGRDKLINAINTVSADFDKVLVITHIPEIIESFPVQLRVEKGSSGSRVRVL